MSGSESAVYVVTSNFASGSVDPSALTIVSSELTRIYREDTHTSNDKGCPSLAYDKRIPTVFPDTGAK